MPVAGQAKLVSSTPLHLAAAPVLRDVGSSRPSSGGPVIDPPNAHDLAELAGEIGADVFSGDLRHPSDRGGWLPHGTMPKSTQYAGRAG
jgi:hypothetical protein